MRIIFVGIHNKPDKQPLDSTTKSGRIIDKIISQLDYECIKTNLFNLDHIPKDKNTEEWFWTHLPTHDDIVVLLGKDVQKYFNHNCITISVDHPAKRMNIENYIKETVLKIKSSFKNN